MKHQGKDSTHLYIKDHVQLFIDNLAIEATMDLTRRWYRPVKDGTPGIVKDKPWENIPYFTYSNYAVVRDATDGKLKCWYEDLKLRKKGSLHGRWFAACQCYAESEDGIRWVKPGLDVREVDGRKTNIVIGADERGEVHSAGVVLDPDPPTPEERFRMIYTLMPGGPDRIECAHSADGIHWTVYDERPTCGISGDQLNDVSILFYDDLSRCFVMNTRHFLQWGGRVRGMPDMGNKPHSEWRSVDNFATLNRRRVWQTYSHDFIHWSEPVLIADVDDDQDNLDTSLYGMSQCKIGTLHVGFAGMIHIVDNTMDVHLLTSRDGVNWQRAYQFQPFVSPGGEGAWDRYMVSCSSPPVEMGDEYWFYLGGSQCHHDWWYMSSIEDLDHPETKNPEAHARFGLVRAVLRKDGFASLAANRLREGCLVTREVVSNGTTLVINGRCQPGGTIRAEVVDANNATIPGFDRESCDVFTGDLTAHVVSWKGQTQIPSEGQGLFFRRLRFYLKDAEIFSFRLAQTDDVSVEQSKWGT